VTEPTSSDAPLFVASDSIGNVARHGGDGEHTSCGEDGTLQRWEAFPVVVANICR